MMKAIANVLPLLLYGLLTTVLAMPVRSELTAASPNETLLGLTPGKQTVPDAVRILGRYDIILPGQVSGGVGGDIYSTAYRWSPGLLTATRGVTIETSHGSDRINLVMIDSYPDLGTSRGLTTLVSDTTAVRLYGLPDHVFEWRRGDVLARESFYFDEGLYLVLLQIPGEPNWTITKIILTYPAFLRNAVSVRIGMVLRRDGVEDITSSYRVWARLAIPPE